MLIVVFVKIYFCLIVVEVNKIGDFNNVNIL